MGERPSLRLDLRDPVLSRGSVERCDGSPAATWPAVRRSGGFLDPVVEDLALGLGQSAPDAVRLADLEGV